MRRHHLTRAGFAVIAALALGAMALPANAQLWTGAGSADDLSYRLSVIDAELADIRARIGAEGGGNAGSGAGLGGDAMLRLDRLEAEIRQLTGRLEQMQFEQRAVAEDAARRFGDIEFRLTELEGGDISNLAPVQPLGGGATAPAGDGGPAVSISERGDLDRAIEDIKQGRFDLGEDRLRSFLTAYPGSPLTGEALYWMGESQFVRGAYQNAARSYLDGYNSDRGSASAPLNLMRLGVTLGRLGQLNEACLTLREVRNQFPSAPPDVLGSVESELGALSCG
ncbi:MAG TPA: tol-pal system protein YbgF [Thermohalobaculum sp.]|nr:tol-pal system protein YbgF [Thermohalobaculum sp.]